jgi:hypothetical protein
MKYYASKTIHHFLLKNEMYFYMIQYIACNVCEMISEVKREKTEIDL